jgi:hypothetical protein
MVKGLYTVTQHYHKRKWQLLKTNKAHGRTVMYEDVLSYQSITALSLVTLSTYGRQSLFLSSLLTVSQLDEQYGKYCMGDGTATE